ncbi:gliding motility-associated C-terminal domain-containing protein [Croceitalea vernalis]|uniref:Gliding motility-associated C-terminal domain-containing protein n=1 Tax=Croceitalea vernalis TaxID=3075599 RepID=A0ABU3BFU6_9FLAO|nr:gliding motility-associated C-terminal domain-containing protein [Croceitalea sp. P007]MDT0621043.1 gliding motility-associated C-terminal domain-containing protein [Croceitalea sp. P007]
MNFAKNLGLQIESFSERTLFFCIKISLFFTLIGQSCVYGQQISINDPISVNEGNAGVATITFIVSIDAADFLTFAQITADYEVFGGLENGTTGTVTFPVFSTDDQTIDVTTTGDFIVEADEIVTIVLSNPSANATILDNTGISSFLNDDFGNVTLIAIDADAAEAGLDTGEFEVDLGAINGTSAPITINFTYGGASTAELDGSDFELLPLTLDIPVGQQTANIVLTPINDNLIEASERVRLNLQSTSEPVLFPLAATGVGSDRDDIFIADDDLAGFTILESDGNTETNESGTSDTFTVVLDSEPISNVVIDVASDDITEGVVTPSELTFTPSDYNIAQTVTVTGQNDALVDGDQAFNIELVVNNAQSDDDFDNLPNQEVVVTNLNDDVFDVTILATDDTATEVGTTTGAFTISLDQVNNTGNPIQINYSVSGTATSITDFVALGTSIEIPDGDQTAVITVTPINDTEIEPVETVIIDLDTGPDYTIGIDNQALVNIESEDLDAISINSVTQAEGDAGSVNYVFTVSVDGGVPASNDITFTYDSADGTATTADSDYEAELAESGAILTGQVSTSFNIEVNGDTEVEADEFFRVNLSNPINAIINNGQGIGTIENDDQDFISIGDVTLNEGDSGITSFDFVVSIDGGGNAINEIEFTYSTQNGTAEIVDGDYNQVITGSGKINVGDNTTTLSITVNGDLKVEGTESFEVNLTGAVGAGITGGQGIGTILNDDSAALTIADVSGAENDGPITVSVVLDNPVSNGFNVSVATADDSATLADNDYTQITNQQLIFSGVANEVETFTVSPTADVIIEPDENLVIELLNLASTPFSIDISDTAEVLIINDDSCAAGTIAPVLNSGEPTTFCDDFNQDLDNYTLSTAPLDAVLKWSSSNTNLEDINTHLDNPVVSVPGTYYGFFFDAANNCVSPELVIEISASVTPSPGTTTNAAACNVTGNGGPVSIDLDAQITGSDDGVWTIVTDPSGGAISISASNQVNFNGSTAGIYEFRYTTTGANAPCENQSSDLTITVSDCSINCNGGDFAPTLDSSQPTNFCDVVNTDLNDYVTDSAPAGSVLTWSTSPDPLQVSAHRSSFVTSPGTYFGFFFDDADGTNSIDCSSPTIEITLVLNITPSIDATSGDVRCGAGTVNLTAVGSTGATLNWYDSLSSTTILGTGSDFTTPIVTETTSFFVEATANGCFSERLEVIATVNIEPNPGMVVSTTGCNEAEEDGTTLTDLDDVLTDANPGIWSIFDDPSGLVVIDEENVVDFDGLPSGNYIFTYTTTDAVAPCENQAINVTIMVVDCNLDNDNDGLNDDIEEDIGTDPDNPDTDGDGILDGTEVVDGTDPLDDCDSLGGTPLPDGDCDADGLTNGEEADLGTDPFDADTDGDGLTDGEEVLVVDDPSTTAIPEEATNPLDSCDPFLTDDCNADPVDLQVLKTVDIAAPLINTDIVFTITLSNLSMNRAINIEVDDLISDESGFEYVSSTTSNGFYDVLTGVWSIDELLPEQEVSLELTVTVRTFGLLSNTATLMRSTPLDDNISNNTSTVQLNINRSSCVDLGTICNLFTPNGDGINDFLVLVGHENYPNNTLLIYDRYGNNVYASRGYNSTWDGTGENGNLPKGTYFYILDLVGDGTEATKGWIQIIR